ncbi:VWA domain-containing protein [Patescibacteria group bacterium]|nr:VWA domain-containing protein [Patescibacteria group bacterium]
MSADLVLFQEEAGAEIFLEADSQALLSVIILDRSGSMKKFDTAPYDCVNKHLDAMRTTDDGIKRFCTIITFADKYRVEMPITPVADSPDFYHYYPDGTTLLWKTVYKVLKELVKLFKDTPDLEKNLKIVVGVFSDGQDNLSLPPDSKKNYQTRVCATAKKARDLGIELFTYGIGISAADLARGMGFPVDEKHAVTVEASARGIETTSSHFTEQTTTGFHGSDFEDWRSR